MTDIAPEPSVEPAPPPPPPLPERPAPLCERDLVATIPYAEAIARDSFERMRKAFAESGIEVPTT